MGYEWLKLYSHGILRGSIVAQMSLEEQMTWVKLLCFASECRDRGIIRRAKGIPFEREQLAHQIGVTELLLNTTIEKCVQDENADDCSTRIVILPDGSLQIANWEKYQGKPTKKDKAQIPLSPEDKEADQQAKAAKFGYLQPEAAKRGITAREFEEAIDKKVKMEVGNESQRNINSK